MKISQRNLRQLFRVFSQTGLLFTLVMVFSSVDCSDVDLENDGRLPNHVIPRNYSIILTPYVSSYDKRPFLHGESKIGIEVVNATSIITLHFVGFVSNATLLDGESILVPKIVRDKRLEMIHLNFGRTLISTGFYTLNMIYLAYPSAKRSMFVMIIPSSKQRRTCLTTNFKPAQARYVFPCWDEPKLKATFRISVNYNRNKMILSNMPIDHELTDIFVHFDTSPPMATRDVAIAIIRTKSVEKLSPTGVHMHFRCRRRSKSDLTFAYDVAKKVTRDVASYLEYPVGVPRLEQIVVPNMHEDTVINLGLVIYREKDVVYNQQLDPIAQKVEAARLVARAMAHQWFYNVTPSWWDYQWLHEGLVIFSQTKALLNILPEWRMRELFVVQIQHESLHLDFAYNLKPLVVPVNTPREIRSLFSYGLYVKAPVIFSMLEHVTSYKKFWDGINRYIKKCNVAAVTPDDLWIALQPPNETNVSAEHELKTVMKSWMYQENYPIVHVKRDYKNNIAIIQQQRFGERAEDLEYQKVRWWIPISFTTQSNPAFSDTAPRVWLNPENALSLFEIADENHWVIINLQQSGYYRVNYDITNWKLIAKYLKSADYQNIHVLNRAQIIDDAYHLMMANLLEYDVFLDIIGYLSQETDYIAWYPMFKILEYLSTYLPFQENHFLKESMRKIVADVLMKIKYDDDAEEDDLIKCLRQEAAKWACILGDVLCKQTAKFQLQRYLENPEEVTFLPNWKEWTFCNGLANLKAWKKAWDHLLHAKRTDNAHNMLSCSEHSINLYSFVNSERYEKRLRKECTTFIYSIIARQAKDNLDFILANFKKYKIHMVKALSIIIDHLYSATELRKVKLFVLENSGMIYTTVIILNKIEKRQLQISQYTKEIPWQLKTTKIQTAVQHEVQTEKPTLQKLFYRSPGDYTDIVKPLSYRIKLVIPENIEGPSFTINCEYKAAIMVFKETSEIIMHSPDLEFSIQIYKILYRKVFKQQNIILKRLEIRHRIHTSIYDPEARVLILTFEIPLTSGMYEINMKFNNTLRDNKGFFRTSYTNLKGKKIWLLATRFHPTGAHQLFPCWDDPSIKTLFNISVIHPLTHRVLSNVEGSFEVLDEKSGLTTFNNTQELSTDSVAIVILPMFDHVYHVNVNKDEDNKRIWCRPHLKPYVSYVSTVSNSLEMFLDLLLPEAPKLDHVVIPDIQEEVFAHFGLIVYNEEAIVYDENVDPIGRKIEACRLMMRAVAYHRFSTITPSWWSHLWLLDGLVTYFATDNAVLSLWQRMDLFVVQVQHEALHLDADYKMASLTVHIDNPESRTIHSTSFFLKAPAIMRMLQYVSVRQYFIFFNAMKTIIREHHSQELTPNYLWATIENIRRTLDDPNKHIYNRYKLSKVMNAWISQMHYPLLEVTRNYSTRTVTMSQKSFDMYNQNRWWIPITYTWQRGSNFGMTFPKVWLDPNVQNLTLEEIYDNDDWFIANIRQIGYYRVNYDPTNWQLIADYLNSEKYYTIHVLNRAQIIDDAYHLTITNQLDYQIFLNLTSYLSRDKDYIAWYPMFKIFEYLSVYLPFEESLPLKNHMLKILHGLLSIIKYKESDEEKDLVKCLRLEAVKWACIMNDVYCKKMANFRLKNYLKDPEKHKLLPGWKEWTYCHGLTLANEVTRITVWTFAGSYNNRNILFMPCFGRIVPTLMLNRTLSKVQQSTRTNLLYIIIRSIPANHLNSLNYTLELLEEYIYFYTNEMSDVAKILIIIINRVYTYVQLTQIEDYALTRVREIPILEQIKYITNIRWHRIKHQVTKITDLIRNKNTIKH